MGWVKLEVKREEIVFVESEWSRCAYDSRDDYLNGLLNMALINAMNDAERPIGGCGPRRTTTIRARKTRCRFDDIG